MSDPESHTKTKRDERQTYRDLKLPGALKTRAQKARAERTGVYRVVVGKSLDRPPLKVKTQDYQAARLAVTRELLERASKAGINLPIERLHEHLAPQIELATYDRLAEAARHQQYADAAFASQAGRKLTPEERRAFAEVAAMKPKLSGDEASSHTQNWQSHNRRQNRQLIDSVLGHVAERQTHNPMRYRTAWAEAVGADAAAQSELCRVDAARGIVFFRCVNSTLSYKLQRTAQLPKKLTRLLGISVRKVQVSY